MYTTSSAGIKESCHFDSFRTIAPPSDPRRIYPTPTPGPAREQKKNGSLVQPDCRVGCRFVGRPGHRHPSGRRRPTFTRRPGQYRHLCRHHYGHRTHNGRQIVINTTFWFRFILVNLICIDCLIDVTGRDWSAPLWLRPFPQRPVAVRDNSGMLLRSSSLLARTTSANSTDWTQLKSSSNLIWNDV